MSGISYLKQMVSNADKIHQMVEITAMLLVYIGNLQFLIQLSIDQWSIHYFTRQVTCACN